MRCRVSYSMVPAATVPTTPPAMAVNTTRPVGATMRRPPLAAKTSTVTGTTIEPSRIREGTKLRFSVRTRVCRTSR